MLPSLFPLVTLLSSFTLVSSIAIEGRNSWRLSHGLPPARPRRFHSSATETAHRRSASPTPPVVNGGDFEQSSLTSPWAKSSGLAISFPKKVNCFRIAQSRALTRRISSCTPVSGNWAPKNYSYGGAFGVIANR
ncbi:hypothetical protein DL96DRAFT_639135 [Flagelloscypha sp. PMI_526]|nr:hypothetical protein DL96DRAFT_639135 [Flagelloscypha sp. PMI_526]